MVKFSYDIVIRTVGLGGEKYKALLDSIEVQKHKPENIYVILPVGATPPREELGYEKFVYATRGMMTQRLYSLVCSSSEYILFCDDDISFDGDFVEKLYTPMIAKGYDFTVGELLAFLPPAKGMKHVLPIICAAAVPSLFNREKYVRIMRSTGYQYYRFTPKEGCVLPTESAAGTMFFCSKKAFERLDFSVELWAQHGALAPADDQIMFYKAYCKGLKVGVVTNAHYVHQDAKQSRPTQESKDNKTYWSGYNRVVFWKRFILDREKNIFGRVLARISFYYYILSVTTHVSVRKIYKPKEKFSLKKQIGGYVDGFKFIKSDGYKKIPPI